MATQPSWTKFCIQSPDDVAGAVEHANFKSFKICPHCGARNPSVQPFVRDPGVVESPTVIEILDSPVTTPQTGSRFAKLATAHDTASNFRQNAQLLPRFGNTDRNKTVRATAVSQQQILACQVTVYLKDIVIEKDGTEVESSWQDPHPEVVVRADKEVAFRAEIQRPTFDSLQEFIEKDLIAEGYHSKEEAGRVVRDYSLELVHTVTAGGTPNHRITKLGRSALAVQKSADLLDKFDKKGGVPWLYVIGKREILVVRERQSKQSNTVKGEGKAVPSVRSGRTSKVKPEKTLESFGKREVKTEDSVALQAVLEQYRRPKAELEGPYSDSDCDSIPEIGQEPPEDDEQLNDMEDAEIDDAKTLDLCTPPGPQRGKRARSESQQNVDDVPATRTRAKESKKLEIRPKRWGNSATSGTADSAGRHRANHSRN